MEVILQNVIAVNIVLVLKVFATKGFNLGNIFTVFYFVAEDFATFVLYQDHF